MLDVIIVTFAVMALGWLSRHLRLMPAGSDRILNDFVYYIALPALLLAGLSATPLGLAHFQLFLLCAASITLMMAIVLGAWKLGWVDRKMGGVLLICGFFGNIVYMGFPIIALTYGHAGLADAAILSLTYNLFLFGLAFLALEFMTGKHSMKFATGKLLRNPVIIGCLAGAALSLSGMVLPPLALSVLNVLGSTTVPVALFAMGLFLYGKKLAANPAKLAILTLAKLVLFPLIVLVLAYFIPVRGLGLQVSFLEALMPIGAMNFVIAQKFGLDDKLVAEAIVVSTLLSLPLIGGFDHLAAFLLPV